MFSETTAHRAVSKQDRPDAAELLLLVACHTRMHILLFYAHAFYGLTSTVARAYIIEPQLFNISLSS